MSSTHIRTGVMSLLAIMLLQMGCDNSPPGSPKRLVRGTVEDSDGCPVPGIQVSVNYRPPQTTGENGMFEFSEVDAPYDLLVLWALDVRPYVLAYQGLKTRAPIVRCCGAPTSVVDTATAIVRGTVPLGMGEQAALMWVPDDRRFAAATTSIESEHFELRIPMRSALTLKGWVFLLFSHIDDFSQLTYTTAGQKQFMVQVNMEHKLLFEESELFPVESTTIGGVVVVPNEYSLFRREIFMQWMGYRFSLQAEADPEPEFSYTVPIVPDVTFAIDAQAIRPDGLSSFGGALTTEFIEGLEPGQSGLKVVLQNPPELRAPPDLYSPVDYSTEFSWTGSDHGIYTMIARDSWLYGSVFQIFTDEPVARIPKANIFGLSLERHNFYWSVVERVQYPSVDTFLQHEPPEHDQSLSTRTVISARRRFQFGDKLTDE